MPDVNQILAGLKESLQKTAKPTGLRSLFTSKIARETAIEIIEEITKIEKEREDLKIIPQQEINPDMKQSNIEIDSKQKEVQEDDLDAMKRILDFLQNQKTKLENTSRLRLIFNNPILTINLELSKIRQFANENSDAKIIMSARKYEMQKTELKDILSVQKDKMKDIDVGLADNLVKSFNDITSLLTSNNMSLSDLNHKLGLYLAALENININIEEEAIKNKFLDLISEVKKYLKDFLKTLVIYAESKNIYVNILNVNKKIIVDMYPGDSELINLITSKHKEEADGLTLENLISHEHQIQRKQRAIPLNFLEKLKEKNILLSKDELKKLLSLSWNNLQRLQTIINTLNKSNLLNEVNYTKAFELVTNKIVNDPKNLKSEYKYEAGENACHQLTLNGGAIVFYTQRRKLMKDSGKGATVQNAYDKPYQSNSNPKVNYAVKIIPEGKKSAAIESKYSQLFNRFVSFFKHEKKSYIIYDYQSGVPLWDLIQERKNDFSKQSPEFSQRRRLAWAKKGLEQLQILHDRFRFHGDVKELNFILELDDNNHDNDKMKLIDFGSTHKVGTTKKIVTPPSYIDKENQKYSFGNDIYAMRIVIARLFPEIFSVKMTHFKTTIEVIHNHPEPFEKAIIDLVNNMADSLENRCTASEAIEYCRRLLIENTDSLTDRLKQIQQDTIYNTEATLEHVFLGKLQR